jgi:hypothetical protein
MRLVATKNVIFRRLVIAFTIITLIFWQMGMDATAKAAVDAAPLKPKYNAAASKPYLPIWWPEPIFRSNPYLPICRLEPIW